MGTRDRQEKSSVSTLFSGDENKVRGNWSRQIEFTLSCLGYSVGLSNIWRFPYLCARNGGGVFLIPYTMFLIICGMPLFFLEVILGQFSGEGPILVWKLCPLFRGVGYASISTNFIYLVAYNAVPAWILYYLAASFARNVPWGSCGNPWNTPTCIDFTDRNSTSTSNATGHGMHGNISHYDYVNTDRPMSAAEEYFNYKVLDISGGIQELGYVKWELMLTLFVSSVLCFLCLLKGVKSSGKAVYITAPSPYLFLTILLIRGASLPGSLEGVKYYLIADWSKLLGFQIWREACTQIFFTLGPAWGSLITMASFNRFHHNCLKDAICVSLSCCVTSFYGGFALFSMIGFMSHTTGLPIEKVVTHGPGLAFVAYPQAVALLPVSPFWAVCIFLMMFVVFLDTQFAVMEVIITCLMDQFPKLFRGRRILLMVFFSLAIYVLSIPLTTRAGMYIFCLLDWYFASFVSLIGFLELFVVSYVYGVGRFYEDIAMILRKKPSRLWAALWCGLAPVLLFAVLVLTLMDPTPPTYDGYVYPRWTTGFGWFLALCSISLVPLVAIYSVLTAEGSLWTRVTTLMRPAPDWGPSLEGYRNEYRNSEKSDQSWWQRMSLSDTSPKPIHLHSVIESSMVAEKEALNDLTEEC